MTANTRRTTFSFQQLETQVDSNLPRWARRSNPVVRRELGRGWKMLFPNVRVLSRVLFAQLLMALLLPRSLLMTITLPIAALSTLLIPVVLLLYGRVLVTVSVSSATSMTLAHNHHTLDLLRVSSLSTWDIILGKVAASVWHRMDDIDMVVLAVTLFSLPMLVIQHLGGLEPGDPALSGRILTSLTLVSLPLRVLLEPFMLGALGVLLGSVLRTRAGAVTTTMGLGLFYVLLVNMTRLIAMPFANRLIADIVLPLVLPLLITAGALWLTHWLLRRN